MLKPSDPRELAVTILLRSPCSVKVGAVIADRRGILSWAWNSPGSGFGEHAEMAAIRRSNRARLEGATIYVATVRARNNKPIMSRPCEECMPVIEKWGLTVVYRNADSEWIYV